MRSSRLVPPRERWCSCVLSSKELVELFVTNGFVGKAIDRRVPGWVGRCLRAESRFVSVISTLTVLLKREG